MTLKYPSQTLPGLALPPPPSVVVPVVAVGADGAAAAAAALEDTREVPIGVGPPMHVTERVQGGKATL